VKALLSSFEQGQSIITFSLRVTRCPLVSNLYTWNYLEYYKLKEHPLSNVVDSRFYYNSPLHSDAML